MEVLEIDGRRLVKASKAAKENGYTSDYVGQLCRSGAVYAERVGRSWYVDEKELRAHRKEKKHSVQKKALKKLNKETAVKVRDASETVNTSRSRKLAVTYEPDDGPLLPELRKHHVAEDKGPDDEMPDENYDEEVSDDVDSDYTNDISDIDSEDDTGDIEEEDLESDDVVEVPITVHDDSSVVPEAGLAIDIQKPIKDSVNDIQLDNNEYSHEEQNEAMQQMRRRETPAHRHTKTAKSEPKVRTGFGTFLWFCAILLLLAALGISAVITEFAVVTTDDRMVSYHVDIAHVQDVWGEIVR